MRVLSVLLCALLVAGCSKEKENKRKNLAAEKSAWTLKIEKNDFKKEKYVAGVVSSDNKNIGIFSVICTPESAPGSNLERRFWVTVMTEEFLGESQYKRDLYYIIDGEDPVHDVWIYTDKSAFKMAMASDYDMSLVNKNINELINRLITANRLRIQVKTYRGIGIDYSFNVDGFKNIFKKVNDECGKPWEG